MLLSDIYSYTQSTVLNCIFIVSKVLSGNEVICFNAIRKIVFAFEASADYDQPTYLCSLIMVSVVCY